MSYEDIQKFYNQRGELQLGRVRLVGSGSLRPSVRAGFEFAEEQIAKIKGLRGLDLCCGVGAFSPLLAQQIKSVDAVDLSNKSIEVARHLAKSIKQENINFYESEALAFLKKQAQAQYDLVFCAGSLYYFDLAEVLSEVVRVLKPGGMFISYETSGSQFFMHLYRRFRNILSERRDIHSMKNLIRLRDVPRIQSHFTSCEVRYFDFLTYFAEALRFSKKLQASYLMLARPIDNFILNKLGLHFLAAKIYIKAIK